MNGSLSPMVKPRQAPISLHDIQKDFSPLGYQNAQMPSTRTRLLEEMCDRFLMAQEATGLNKSEFAARVGLTPSQLTNISRYRNPPTHQAIAAACSEFGYTADWFYTGSKVGFRDPALAHRLPQA